MPRKGGTGDLMRPWLEKHLDETSFKEVYWLDPDDRTLVNIPWPHLGKSGGSESEKTAIFKAWAQHKGHKGQDDISKMKHSFASAIRSCEPEITEEIPRKTDEKDPHRVYRINRNQGVERRRAADEAVKQSPITPPPAKVSKLGYHDTGDDNLPTSVAHETITGDGYSGKDDVWPQSAGYVGATSITEHGSKQCSGLKPQQPMEPNISVNPHTLPPLEPAISLHPALAPQQTTLSDVPPNEDMAMRNVVADVLSMEKDQMVIEVKYFGQRVMIETINNPLGCHITADIKYRDVSVHESNEDVDGSLSESMYGPADADQLLLPQPDCAKQAQNDQIKKRLDEVIGSRGIMIYCVEGNIQVEKLCIGYRVFHECPNDPADLPVRIERTEDGQLTTVFDFDGQFMDKLNAGRGKRLVAEAAIIFGKARPHWNGANPVPLVVIVTSSRAAELLRKQDGCESSDSYQQSSSNVLDNLAGYVKKISLNTNETD